MSFRIPAFLLIVLLVAGCSDDAAKIPDVPNASGVSDTPGGASIDGETTLSNAAIPHDKDKGNADHPSLPKDTPEISTSKLRARFVSGTSQSCTMAYRTTKGVSKEQIKQFCGCVYEDFYGKMSDKRITSLLDEVSKSIGENKRPRTPAELKQDEDDAKNLEQSETMCKKKLNISLKTFNERAQEENSK